jgi:hypothetical protein
MKTKNLFTKPTSKNLNEMLNTKFGERLNIDSFSLVQLRKAKSLIENRLSKIQKTGFNENLKNENFHRLKMMHDIIKTAISERSDQTQITENRLVRAYDYSAIEPLTGTYYVGIYSDGYDQFPDLLQKVNDSDDQMEKNYKDLGMIPAKRTSDIDEIKHNAMQMLKKIGPVRESMKNTKKIIKEGEEGKAELIMAIKDMVDRFTGWSEDIAQMQAQTSMELSDAIRNEAGAEAADQFLTSSQPVLDSAFEAVKHARETLSNTISILTGEGGDLMGEPDMDSTDPTGDEIDPIDADPEIDTDIPDSDDAEAEFDLDVDDDSDRAKRESVEQRLRITRMLAS